MVVDKSFVWQLKTDPVAKLIAIYLLDQEARPHSREELASLVGCSTFDLGNAIQAGMVREPPLFAREDADGKRLMPTIAYIPADSPLRVAWGKRTKKRGKDDPESQAP